MTAHKHLKRLVRARMSKTGEKYAAARRQILREEFATHSAEAGPPHFAGNIAATTALRSLLVNAGVIDSHFTEALLFAIAGGVGIGTFSFLYEKEDVATFFLAGRHRWHDDLAYLQAACGRFGVTPIVHETGSATAAGKSLRDMLDEHGVCIAWVDAAELPHRAMPDAWKGGGYHVVTVYSANDHSVTVGDLTDEPIEISAADFAQSRARIKKQKHRLLAIPASRPAFALNDALRGGLAACYEGLFGAGAVKNFATNFSLASLARWAEQLAGRPPKESWERVFAPGPRLWQGLTSVHEFIEHYGTGGGLCRPLYAEALREASTVINDARLDACADRYAALGRRWTALAEMALPDDVPVYRRAKELLTEKAELIHSGCDAEAIRDKWRELTELAESAAAKVPISHEEYADLRGRLHAQVSAIHAEELAAQRALGELVA